MANKTKRNKSRHSKRFRFIIIIEIIVLLSLAGTYYLVTRSDKKSDNNTSEDEKVTDDDGPKVTLSPEDIESMQEQERIQKQIEERDNLIAQADKVTLGYDYDGAIELIESYKDNEGRGYEIYPALVEAIDRYKDTKETLVLYGGSYSSITEFNHIFFHSLIADNSKAFDGDYDAVGYNQFMTTVSEFRRILEILYEDDYVLISIHDMVQQEADDDGEVSFVQAEIMLPEGKKPFVLSQDDVNYYKYMEGDGFASRIVIGEDGRAITEMKLEDGTTVTGPFDIVPILDEFVEKHPDFSYKGAKGILALTGYQGSLGYRTDDPTSPTYEQDKEAVKAVAKALKEDGWEFASHSWGHRDSREISYKAFKTDSLRWMEEVEPLIGSTDVYIFPYGTDFETTMGHYKSDKYKLLKELGFNFFCGVDKAPWMHLKDDYIRMTRRPLDGQAMLEYPERLMDLFDPAIVIDLERPPKNW